jgi:MFS family permease
MKDFQDKFDIIDDSNAAYIIVPVSLAASFVASLVAGSLADRLGRKNIFYIASIIHEVGCIVEITTQSQAGFIAGRIITGVAIGVYSMVVPLCKP